MNDDRFAEQIKTALAQRRPAASRQLADRLEAAAQRPGRPRLLAPTALAVAVAAGVLLVIVTRPGPSTEPDDPAVFARVDDAGARAPSPAATPAPASTPAPAGSPSAAPAKIDVRDPLAGYQAVLDGTSSVSIAPAQVAKLRALATELASQRAYLAERKRDAEAELARALAAANPDDSRVLAAYDRIAAQDAALGRAQLVARLGARAVLDPGQRNAVEGGAQRTAAGRPHIVIRSSIAGSVYLDGKRIGDTPLSATIAPGKHELRLDAPGCDPETKHFDLGNDGEIVLDLEPHRRRAPPARPPPPSPPPALSLEEGPARLRLTTKPSTVIYLDDRPVGQTPIDLTLTTGRHEIRMVGSDQRTRKTLTLTATPGQNSNLSFSFDD